MVKMAARPQGPGIWFNHLLAGVTVLLAFLVCAPDQAQAARGAPLLSNRFTLHFGGFFPFIDSNIRLNSDESGIPGTEIDFENDLALDETLPTIFGTLRWRITPRHRLEGAYFQLHRDGLTTAEDEIRFGDLVVPVGVRVDSSLDVDLGRVTYGYSFFNNGRTEVGILIGAHIASIDATLSIAGQVGNGGPNAVLSDSGDLTAPLPHVGLLATYAFTPNLVSQARLVGFYLSIGDYTGWLIQGNLDVTWQFARHFGLGAGMQYFNFSLDVDTANFDGDFSFDFIGPAVFAVATF